MKLTKKEKKKNEKKKKKKMKNTYTNVKADVVRFDVARMWLGTVASTISNLAPTSSARSSALTSYILFIYTWCISSTAKAG